MAAVGAWELAVCVWPIRWQAMTIFCLGIVILYLGLNANSETEMAAMSSSVAVYGLKNVRQHCTDILKHGWGRKQFWRETQGGGGIYTTINQSTFMQQSTNKIPSLLLVTLVFT